jgi:hypothetical protein
MFKHAVRALIVVVIGTWFNAEARARTIYDGQWSVLIITDRGACDRAYRYGVQIYNGNILYVGSAPVNFVGRVTGGGSVSVTVQSGEQRASGRGRLSRNSGSGRWSGRGPTGSCSGRWTAERVG